MDDLSTMMRAAAGEPPPTRVDLDRLIAGEQRRRRNLTWTAMGTGVAAAVAAILVVPAMLNPGSGGGVPLQFAAPTGTRPVPGTTTAALCGPLSPSPTGPQPPLQSHDTVRARPTEPVAQAVPRLSVALGMALREVLPMDVQVESFQKGCSELQLQWQPSYREYETSARIIKGDEAGFLLIRVMPSAVGDDGHCLTTGDPSDCRRTEFSDGTVATAVTTDLGEADAQQLSVVVRRPDGTSVFLMNNNYSLGTRPGSTEPGLTAKEPLLTVDQMIEIGRHPGLTLYP